MTDLQETVVELRHRLQASLAERDELLLQQAATAEILKVINRSKGDLAPVFDAILEKAHDLCDAPGGSLQLLDGEMIRAAADRGLPEELASMLRQRHLPRSFDRANLQAYQLPDVVTVFGEAPEDPMARALVLTAKARTMLFVPLVHEGSCLGRIVALRHEVRPFTDKQIALLKNFADQAVIAIENVRSFNETREALTRQIATSDILKVIARSPADTRPVFDAIAESANRILGGLSTTVWRFEGDKAHLAAFTPTDAEADAALKAMSPLPIAEFDAFVALESGKFAEVPDTEEEPRLRDLARLRGFRAMLFVPLVAPGATIGFVSVTRKDAGAFNPKDIQLLQTFADQAVIAIENARLFTELSESLEQQTASSEILQVISQSPTDVQPVLDVVVSAARRFCGASDAAIVLCDGEDLLGAAHDGPLKAWVGERRPLDRESVMGRAIIASRTVQVADATALGPGEFTRTQRAFVQLGFKAIAAAPLMREGSAIGALLLRKPEPGAFTPRQVERLEAFAAQAIIAIENVRLFTELRDSLERLKAAQANLIQSEKMASLGQLTAGIAHEIKNPLNFVNNFAGLSVELLGELKEIAAPVLVEMNEDARAEFSDTIDMITSNLDKIAEHGQRADGIVKSMLSHSRGGTGDWQESNINALVEDALNLAYHGARAQDNEFNVTLERDFSPEPKPVELVPQDVTRVFLNLFGNGFYAASKHRPGDAGYRPTLKVSTRDLSDAVEIRVRDNGTGISPEVRSKLFQPFFTTKPTGEGTGLGLSISYDIVTQQHGGTIEVESEPGAFTEFTVRLPRRRRAAPARGVS